MFYTIRFKTVAAMVSMFVMHSHRVKRVPSPYGLFMFSQSAFEFALGPTYVEVTTWAFESVYHKTCIAVDERSDWMFFIC